MGEQDAYTAEHARLMSGFGAKLRAERDRRNVSQETLAGSPTSTERTLPRWSGGCGNRTCRCCSFSRTRWRSRRIPCSRALFVPRERKAPTHFKNGTGGEA